MGKTLLICLFVLSLALSAASVFAQELIVNPGFEADGAVATPPAGWINGYWGGGNQTTNNEFHSGEWSAMLFGNPSFAGYPNAVIQLIPNIVPGTTYVWSGWVKKNADFRVNMRLSPKKADGSYVDPSQYVSGVIDPAGSGNVGFWFKLDNAPWIPGPDVASVEVRLYAFSGPNNGGLDTDQAFYDDVSFQPVPEPGSLLGLGFGLAALVTRLRMRRSK